MIPKPVEILTVIPDIVGWLNKKRFMLDYHPNNHEYFSEGKRIPVPRVNYQQDLIKGNNQATITLLTVKCLDDAIQQSFAILAASYHADRITLFRNHSNPENEEINMNLDYEWSSPSIMACIDDPTFSNIPFHPDFKDLYDVLKEGCAVIAHTNDLSEASKSILKKMEIRSVVIMPVFVWNSLWGFLSMGDCHANRNWTEIEIGAFHTISVILGSVLQQQLNQEELTIARLRAEEADRLKSSILANFNHELRTPMTGILGFSEILCEEANDPKTRKMAESILLSGKRLLATLNSMIELSQFEARKVLFKLVETKLNELILIACEPHCASAQKKHLGFDIFMNESIYSFIEAKLFTQLLNYIIENAIKFTEKGKITVETKIVWDEEKWWSCIMVSDTGPGIPEVFHQVIFEEFRQVSEGYNRNFEGNGLGLTLSKKIVTLMNGKLTLKSEPGNGCTFTIWLPSSQTNNLYPQFTPVQQEQQKKSANPPLTSPNPIPPPVLIVEDNRLNSELIQIYLRHICRCEIARNGEEAIELAAKHDFQAILMDINLGSGIDGMETTRRIRKLPNHTKTPVIAVTGYTMETDKEEIMKSGCSHYLPKPIEKIQLIELISRYINHS